MASYTKRNGNKGDVAICDGDDEIYRVKLFLRSNHLHYLLLSGIIPNLRRERRPNPITLENANEEDVCRYSKK